MRAGGPFDTSLLLLTARAQAGHESESLYRNMVRFTIRIHGRPCYNRRYVVGFQLPAGQLPHASGASVRESRMPKETCFVIMPFASEFDGLWRDVIRPTVIQHGDQCTRGMTSSRPAW